MILNNLKNFVKILKTLPDNLLIDNYIDDDSIIPYENHAGNHIGFLNSITDKDILKIIKNVKIELYDSHNSNFLLHYLGYQDKYQLSNFIIHNKHLWPYNPYFNIFTENKAYIKRKKDNFQSQKIIKGWSKLYYNLRKERERISKIKSFIIFKDDAVIGYCFDTSKNKAKYNFIKHMKNNFSNNLDFKQFYLDSVCLRAYDLDKYINNFKKDVINLYLDNKFKKEIELLKKYGFAEVEDGELYFYQKSII